MHSGASVAQPCLACGAGRETRTPTPKRWYLKPMRLPIPPYPHVGRRYVTMFRKGQARRSPAFRFARTFLASRAGQKEARPAFATGKRIFGTRKTGKPSGYRDESGVARHRPPRLPTPLSYGRFTLTRGRIDIIYNMARRAHDGAGTAARSRRITHRRKAAGGCLHQKHTNWSQIMHESPESGHFTGLHCV